MGTESNLVKALEGLQKALAEKPEHVALTPTTNIRMMQVGLMLIANTSDPHLMKALFASTFSVKEAADAFDEMREKVRKDERYRLSRLLSTEANRIFNTQEREYPSNVLDVVVMNLNEGNEENITVMPEWLRKQQENARRR